MYRSIVLHEHWQLEGHLLSTENKKEQLKNTQGLERAL